MRVSIMDNNDSEDFFTWLEQPRQIVLFSLFFILFSIVITKLSRRQRGRKDVKLRVRDPRKGHRWFHNDFLDKPTYCSVCETSLVRGSFCDTCWICVHDECEIQATKRFACKVLTLCKTSSRPRHHWVKGNVPLCSECHVCLSPCGNEPRLSDYRCLWCQKTVHDTACYNQVNQLCDYGPNQHIIIPPYCISLKETGWRGRRNVVVKEVVRPPFEPWKPLIVFTNPKSGGNEGEKLLKAFRGLLNPVQVIDVSEMTPSAGLEFCRLLPDIQFRILVCGGDGTIGWVLNEMDQMEIKIKPHIAVLPLGTGNDLARSLGWALKYVGDEHEVEDMLVDIENAQVTRFDRWKVTIQNDSFYRVGRRTAKVQAMNSYVSVGCDAQVVLNFHKHRESQPTLFSNRILNKLMYFIYGSRDVLQQECKDLHKRIELRLDGQLIELPYLEGIVILNINSWCGGCELWKSIHGESIPESRYDDGYLEVVGLYSSLHIAKLRVNLADPVRLGQAKNVEIRIRGSKPLPMQLDGEPWEQRGCTVSIGYHNQAMMLTQPALPAS